MFERDPYGLYPQLPEDPSRDSGARLRHEIAKTDYLQRRRARLSAEAAERLRQEDERQGAAMANIWNRLAALPAALSDLLRPVRARGARNL